MSNKVITFLGISDYATTIYHLEDQSSKAVRYFPLALHEFFPDYEIVVLATQSAANEHSKNLGNLRLEPIGEITSEAELWDAFEVIQRQVADGDRVVFDITHSFRSLPFLALLTLAYLRVIRQFDLESVLYAPYKEYKETPVYDLSRFVDLLDWTTATHLFLETGHAAPLVEQLKRSEWADRADAGALEQISAALRLARPDEARESVYAWTQIDIEPQDLNPSARPFGLLLKQVETEFERIAPQEPQSDDLEQELRQELALIRWNLKRGQLMSAVTVAREWLVSALCWLVGWTALVEEKDCDDNVCQVRKWRSRKGREKAEKALNALRCLANLNQEEREKQVGSKTPLARDLYQSKLGLALLLGQAWNVISNLRNDLSHAGKIHTTCPRSLTELVAEVEQAESLLQRLEAQLWPESPTR